MPLTTPGKSSTDSLTKRVLIRWGNSTQPQHSDEQLDNQHKPPWLRLTAAVVCLSRGISFDPELNDLNFQSFRVWVTLLYQWQPYLQAWDPLRVRLNWVEVSENIPSKALFILVLDIQDCLLLCNLTREFDVRQSTQCFVPVEMYFEWSYSLKPPVTPFLVITLKLFQNRVHRRLPLRQSFEVSGHLRSWASMSWKWASLRWADPSSLSLIIIQESIILTFIGQLSLVISRLQASPLPWTHWGRTSIALDSKLPCKPFRCVSCKSRRWSVLLYEALPLVSRFWFCQRRLLQTKNPLDSSDLFPLLISLPSFNLQPDIPAHS